MLVHSIIFDLDGTLIDSAPSIIKSIEVAFEKVGIEPIKPLNKDLIGPPLKDIFRNLVSELDKEKIYQLIECFRNYYDVSGYKETRVYDAVTEMLAELAENSLNLYIATNKRLVPTLKIIEHLKWTTKFEEIYALDYFEPVMQNKKALLQHLYNILPNSNKGVVYVGDRAEDADSAEGAGFPFIGVEWGYGLNNSIRRNVICIKHPSALNNALQQYSEAEK